MEKYITPYRPYKLWLISPLFTPHPCIFGVPMSLRLQRSARGVQEPETPAPPAPAPPPVAPAPATMPRALEVLVGFGKVGGKMEEARFFYIMSNEKKGFFWLF